MVDLESGPGHGSKLSPELHKHKAQETQESHFLTLRIIDKKKKCNDKKGKPYEENHYKSISRDLSCLIVRFSISLV